MQRKKNGEIDWRRTTLAEIIGEDPPPMTEEERWRHDRAAEKRSDELGTYWYIIGVVLAFFIFPPIAFLVIIVGALLCYPKYKK